MVSLRSPSALFRTLSENMSKRKTMSDAEPVSERSVYQVQLSGDGDYGALQVREYGIEKAFEELLRAELRDKAFPKATKKERTRVQRLEEKWREEGFSMGYELFVFDTKDDMMKAINMANCVPTDYDATKHSNADYIFPANVDIPEAGTLSDTDSEADDDEAEESD